jgi:hypothetical protein
MFLTQNKKGSVIDLLMTVLPPAKKNKIKRGRQNKEKPTSRLKCENTRMAVRR